MVDPRSTPYSPRLFITKRLHALIDIGEFLLGFTIEEIEGAFEARAHLFDLHTRSWLPISVPILPSENEGQSLPIDGKWEMKMTSNTSILCIASNQSKCSLFRLHIDRSATKFPISIFIAESRDIRPVHHALLGRAFECTVLYEHWNGDVRIAVVTDDNQEDRDSVRLFEMNKEGEMEYIISCNLTNKTLGLVMARSSEGHLLMIGAENERRLFGNLKEGIFVNRMTGEEKIVEIQGWNGIFPHFDDWRFPLYNRVLLGENGTSIVDDKNEIWCINANQLEWTKCNVKLTRARDTSTFLTLTDGRVLCVATVSAKDHNNEAMEVFMPVWKWIRPTPLKELAQTAIDYLMKANGDNTDVIHNRMLTNLRRGCDTTIAFVLSIEEFILNHNRKKELR